VNLFGALGRSAFKNPNYFENAPGKSKKNLEKRTFLRKIGF